MNTNNKSGKADQGSRLYLQEYMAHAKDELSEFIIAASPSLLAFMEGKTKIEWKSPLAKDDFYEYRDDFLKVLGLEQETYQEANHRLIAFWPKIGPQWDGLAIVEGNNREIGLLLVEAKAHITETKSSLKAESQVSIDLINQSIAIAQGYYGLEETKWTQNYYQLGNRIAFLYFMNEILHIPTWLVLLNFTDGAYKTTSRGEWLAHYHEIYRDMGINYANHTLLNYVIQVFPQCYVK
ncbi:MAG TPA: hypothetical protein VFC84_15230 [Desulfosporosinus sp.]|nr:hypothetical protein [Desulfosporosinus sp.]